MISNKNDLMDEETKKRLNNVFELLFRVLEGEFTYRIPKTEKDDILETLSTFLNQVSENFNLLEMRLKIDTVKYRKDVHGIPVSQQNNKVLKERDIQKIKMIGAYIEQYPEKRIPSLYLLAVEFGTNEYKLKKGFKYYYGLSVFRFQKKHRLRKAHLLIQTTDDSINKISRRSGFKNAAHFSKVFKKQYGYSPITLKLKRK